MATEMLCRHSKTLIEGCQSCLSDTDWELRDETTYYHVTGVLTSGRRFKRIETTSFMHAMGINLYRGSVWQIDLGKRTLIKRVYN